MQNCIIHSGKHKRYASAYTHSIRKLATKHDINIQKIHSITWKICINYKHNSLTKSQGKEAIGIVNGKTDIDSWFHKKSANLKYFRVLLSKTTNDHDYDNVKEEGNTQSMRNQDNNDNQLHEIFVRNGDNICVKWNIKEKQLQVSTHEESLWSQSTTFEPKEIKKVRLAIAIGHKSDVTYTMINYTIESERWSKIDFLKCLKRRLRNMKSTSKDLQSAIEGAKNTIKTSCDRESAPQDSDEQSNYNDVSQRELNPCKKELKQMLKDVQSIKQSISNINNYNMLLIQRA